MTRTAARFKRKITFNTRQGKLATARNHPRKRAPVRPYRFGEYTPPDKPLFQDGIKDDPNNFKS